MTLELSRLRLRLEALEREEADLRGQVEQLLRMHASLSDGWLSELGRRRRTEDELAVARMALAGRSVHETEGEADECDNQHGDH